MTTEEARLAEVGPKCCVLCRAGHPHARCIVACTCPDSRHEPHFRAAAPNEEDRA